MNKKIIHTVIEACAAQNPTQIAVESEKGQITYELLNAKANQLAHLLRELGLKREMVVQVYMPTGVNLVISLLGVFKGGGVYLPIDKSFAPKRLSQIFKETNDGFLITGKDMLAAVEELLISLDVNLRHVITIDENKEVELYSFEGKSLNLISADCSRFPTSNPDLVNEPEDGNYIMYTSGSTGEGKAFLGCHKSLSHFIHWEHKELGIDGNMRVSQLSNLAFDASLRDILLPLMCGGTVLIPSEETKSNFLNLARWLDSKNIDVVHCVPSVLRLLSKELASGDFKLGFKSLKYILLAGEILYAKDIHAWRQVAGEHTVLINLYGTSESTLAKTFHRIENVSDNPSQLIPAGKPIANTLVTVINDGVLCETGEIGEVYIITPFTTKGYYNNEALTNEIFVQNPLVKDRVDIIHRTGDRGRFLADKTLEVHGRLDEQVKINGIRVEPGEVKQAVLSKEGVSEALVMASKNDLDQNELLCYYVSPYVESDELREFLRNELNAYMIPAYLIRLNQFPLTANGKIDKRALPKPENLLISADEYEAPQNEIEQSLEDIWKDVLKLGRISRSASFFNIGGTSLKAIQSISRIYKKHKVLVKINDIFDHPTIAQLAAHINKSGTESCEGIPVITEQPHYNLSHGQKRLWIMDQLNEEKTAFNIPATYEINGNIKTSLLEKAFNLLIERHESLRTTFVSVNSEGKQRVHPHEGEFTIHVMDLTDREEPVTEAEYLAMEDARKPFDLQNGPLFRVGLLQVGHDRHIMLFNMHHIIADFWSFEVLVKELIHIYDALHKGREVNLSSLKVQYKDFADWQNKQLAEKQTDLKNYWLKTLDGNLPVIDLADKPRPAVKSTKGSVVPFYIKGPLAAKVEGLARESAATMFMTQLALVKTLLFAYTGKLDVLIASPVSGRDHRDLEHLIGLFVNMLPVYSHLQIEDSFYDVLRKVKEATLGAQEHKLYPFDLIVEDIGAGKDRSRSPIADVWVQINDNTLSFENGDLPFAISPFETEYTISKVDLTFKFSVESDQIVGYLEYNVDLFNPETIQKMADHFILLAESVVNNPKISLTELKQIIQNQGGDANSYGIEAFATADMDDDF